MADFESRLAAGEILNRSIVWIKDAKLIWTHGTYYTTSNPDAVLFVGQELSEEEKRQARTNIGAIWATATNEKEYPSVTIN